MIVCDNVPINWEYPTTDNDKFVANGIKMLRETTKRLFFERVIEKNDLGIQITRPPRIFYLQANRKNPDNGKLEIWKYTVQGLYDDKKKLYAPQKMTAGLDIDLRVANDPELAFFFYAIFRIGAGKVGYRLRDWEAEAKEKNEEDSLEFQVGDLIFSKMNESDVNLRCHALGVPIQDKKFEQKKRELYSKIKKLHKDKTSYHNYRSFINEAKQTPDSLKLQAYVSKAFIDNILYMDHLLVRYRQGDLQLCTVPVERLKDRIQFIAEWLNDNEGVKEGFLASMSGSIDDIAVDAVDYENVIHVQKLRSIAVKSYHVPPERIPSNAKAEEIREIIREFDPRLINS